MTDIEKAAELASTVLPGPIGEALSHFLNDGVATEDAEYNPHLARLCKRIIYVDRIRRCVDVFCPRRARRFLYGMAMQFVVLGKANTADQGLELAEIAVDHLFAIAPGLPVKRADVGFVNATARLFYISDRMGELAEERDEIIAALRGES